MSIYRATSVMSLGTALSRLTGLLRVIALTYALGVTGSRLADSFSIANTTPNIVFELFLGGILSSIFIPVIVAITARGEEPGALVSTTLVVLALVSVVTAILAPWIIRIYTFRITDPAARAATQELATYLLRWFSPQIFFLGLWAVLRALLDVKGRFGPARFTQIFNNLITAATLVAFALVFDGELTPLSKIVLGAGTTFGTVVHGLALLPFVRGYALRLSINFRSKDVRQVLRLSGYIVVYVLINQAGYWFIQALAAPQQGAITAYQVAFMFFLLPHSLFAVSIKDALHPDLSRAAIASDWSAYRSAFQSGVRGIVFFMAPAAAGIFLLGPTITRLLLVRGAATGRDAAAVSSVLKSFALGLVFFSIFQFATQCFHALRVTRTPALVNAASVGLHVALAVPLFSANGVAGIALGHAASYLFGTAALVILLNKRVGLRLPELIEPVGKMVGSALLMAASITLLRTLSMPSGLSLSASLLVGGLVYFGATKIFAIDERNFLVHILKSSSVNRIRR